MGDDNPTRRAAELSLTQAMYPEQTCFDPHSAAFTFTTPTARLNLRLPDEYPSHALPSLISAHASAPSGRHDLRERMRARVAELDPGDEVLDVIMTNFNDVLTTLHETPPAPPTPEAASSPTRRLTTLVHLHHLLATSKRKQAISPPAPLNGVSKPGHPGILIFSGEESAVREHVSGLRGLKWQTFQVRLEVGEEWAFGWEGVREVESLGEVVRCVDGGEGRREALLGAVGVK